MIKIIIYNVSNILIKIMKIGIIGAIEKEIFLIRDALQNLKKIKIYGLNAYIGSINNTQLILVESGVGKTASTMSITLLMYIYKPNIIINIGSAAKLTNFLNIGDIVISTEVRYHDVDVTAFGYELGQIPKYPSVFVASENLIKIFKLCIKNLNYNIKMGLIISGDTFINHNNILNDLLKRFPTAIAVDMEAASIAHVCYEFQVPFIIIRMISDTADETSHLIFKENIVLSATKSLSIIKQAINQFNIL